MNKVLILLLSLGIFLSACKRELIPTVSKKDLKELNIPALDFEYLSLRSKINYSDPQRSLGATANFRIEKDQRIWFSVSPGFGIEAARGLITPDSLILLNKLQKEFYAYSFTELSQRLGVQVGYPLLQAALLGDLAKPLSVDNKIRRESAEIIVIQEEGPHTITNYFNNQTLKLLKVFLQEANSPNSLRITYGDFKSEEGRVLPFSSELAANYSQKGAMATTEVAFNHQKVEFSSGPLSFPFSIPDTYVRKK